MSTREMPREQIKHTPECVGFSVRVRIKLQQWLYIPYGGAQAKSHGIAKNPPYSQPSPLYLVSEPVSGDALDGRIIWWRKTRSH